MKTITINSFLFVLLLTSCAGIVDRMHSQIDRDLGKMTPTYARKKKKRPFDSVNRKPSQTNRMSSNNMPFIKPSVRRHYAPTSRQRYTARDLIDNQNENSLWSGVFKGVFK